MSLVHLYMFFNIQQLSVFSCNSSSIGPNVSLSVCLLATSFMEVLCCCQCTIVVTAVVVYNISTLWCHTLHFAIIFCILSCKRSSIGHNVSLSVGNKFYGSAMLFLMYDCFQLRQQLYRSQCLFVCLSVGRSVCLSVGRSATSFIDLLCS